MTAEVSENRGSGLAPTITEAAPVTVGLVAMAAPAMAILAEQHWSRDSGAYQPIVIATGAWLIWRKWPALRRLADPGKLGITFATLALGLASYIAGTAFDFATFAAGGLYLTVCAVIYSHFGASAMRSVWLPLIYLSFAVPPPTAWVDRVTAPLKELVSSAATGLLHATGVPIARQGVTIFVGPYQLLVEDACSGMNSLVGLIAISLLYVYLRRGQVLGYSALMVVMAVPIAVTANIVRIMVLILLTNFWGDAVAQSFLHFTAGILVFGVALSLIFAVDARLFPAYQRLRVKA